MKRRSFLASLFAALVTPPLLAREDLETKLPKSLPKPKIRFVCYEEVGISICNTKALMRVQFAAEMPNSPRDILPS